MKSISRKIMEIQSKVDNSLLLKYILPLAVILLTLFYYFPFYGTEQLIQDTAWDGIYDVINPIVVAPFISGALSLVISTVNSSVFVKVLFVLEYLMSFALSLIGLMGAIYLSGLLFYMPHLLIIVLHFILWFRTAKKI